MGLFFNLQDRIGKTTRLFINPDGRIIELKQLYVGGNEVHKLFNASKEFVIDDNARIRGDYNSWFSVYMDTGNGWVGQALAGWYTVSSRGMAHSITRRNYTAHGGYDGWAFQSLHTGGGLRTLAQPFKYIWVKVAASANYRGYSSRDGGGEYNLKIFGQTVLDYNAAFVDNPPQEKSESWTGWKRGNAKSIPDQIITGEAWTKTSGATVSSASGRILAIYLTNGSETPNF